jgi:RNA polymerase sigma-70 factor (ECF subfamily)
MTLTLPAEQFSDLTQSYDERELVERAKSDPAALAELYRLHYQAIAAHVRRRIGSQADADDVVAETFLAVVRYLPRYRWTGVPFQAWLYRLAANQVNRWAKQRRRWVIEQLRSETVCQNNRDESSNHDVERLRLALLTLAPRYQSVLSLYYLEEMPTAAIAQALGCRVGTVKSRLARGRAALRRLLEQ